MFDCILQIQIPYRIQAVCMIRVKMMSTILLLNNNDDYDNDDDDDDDDDNE